MHAHRSNQHAFTIAELIAVIVVSVLLTFILLPIHSTGPHHGEQSVVAQSNLRSLNTGTANFAGDHNDEIFSLSSAEQAQDILYNATGKRTPLNRLEKKHEAILRQRYAHLVLLDYLTDRQPEPIAASPFDKNLINWQENPLGHLGTPNDFPYANGLPTKAGYDMDPIWTDPAIVQLWPFASSYQVVPNAWLDDTDPQYTPSPTSPHHMIKTDSDSPLGGRKMFQVTHPSAKVFMHEEFDHFTNAKNPRYATEPTARVNLAFFDGSVRQERVNDANSAIDKNNPTAVWQQPYIPLDTFPIPNGGLGDQTPLDLRFRWTKGGLKGNDFGSSKISDSDL